MGNPLNYFPKVANTGMHSDSFFIELAEIHI